jgi:hypothetical protein
MTAANGGRVHVTCRARNLCLLCNRPLGGGAFAHSHARIRRPKHESSRTESWSRLDAEGSGAKDR